MSKGGKKQIGAGAHGKGAGAGANTDVPKEKIGENMVLSNRDKSQHSDQRGMDGIFRASNSRIMRQIGSTTMPQNSTHKKRPGWAAFRRERSSYRQSCRNPSPPRYQVPGSQPAL